jgi:hypothetical protein
VGDARGVDAYALVDGGAFLQVLCFEVSVPPTSAADQICAGTHWICAATPTGTGRR